MIDKYGKCPSCNKDWNEGDIKETLSRLSIFQHKSDYEIGKIAQKFGWSETKKTNFSKVITVIVDGKEYYKCPSTRCVIVFDSQTGEQLNSIDEVIGTPKHIESTEDKEEEEPFNFD